MIHSIDVLISIVNIIEGICIEIIENNEEDDLNSMITSVFNEISNIDVDGITVMVEWILNSNEIDKKTFKDFLKKLGKYIKIKKEDPLINEKEKCSICLSNYKVGEFKRVLPICKHTYHKKCIDKWFKLCKNKFCPLCKASYNEIYQECVDCNVLDI